MNKKVGIIGAGNIALEHLKVINKISGLKLYSIYSRTYSKAKKLSIKYKIKILSCFCSR